MTRSPALPLTLLVTSVLLGIGCNEPEVTEETRSAEDRLRTALLGPGSECRRNPDCDSGVCNIGFCVPLVDAGFPWMEYAIAERVREYLAADPTLVQEVMGSHLAAIDGADPFLQGRFAGMLGALGDQRALGVLRKWSTSDTERVRVRATLARARLGDPTVLPTALPLLEHPSKAVVLDALDASEGLRDHPEVIARWLELLGDEDHRIVLRVVGALTRMPALPEGARARLEHLRDQGGMGFLRHDIERALASR